MKIAIINGFDRSGSSMIGGILARHPQVAYLFQPFSSTEVHKSQFEIWRREHKAVETEAFFEGLCKGHVDWKYIASDWFEKHSTSLTMHADKLNLIKETKIHFKIRWLQDRFPEIVIYGIWRDPRGIVCSLMRNNFYEKWYGQDSFLATQQVIESEGIMKPFRRFLTWDLNDTEKMALIVAARTHYMTENLPPRDWIAYEQVLADPNKALGKVIQRFDLDAFNFSGYLTEDYNVIGLPFESPDLWQSHFSNEQVKRLNEIFRPLQFHPPD